MTKRNSKYYIEVNFDLDVKLLKEHYEPITNKKWKTAWTDIYSYLKKHGFSHTLYSGYVSNNPMDFIEATKVFTQMNKDMPWIAYCAKGFRMTKAELESVNLLESAFATKLPISKEIFETDKLVETNIRYSFEELIAGGREGAKRHKEEAQISAPTKRLDNELNCYQSKADEYNASINTKDHHKNIDDLAK